MSPKISRREFVRTAAGIIAGQSLGGFMPKQSRKQKKPNLLFIWTDEQRADTMAAYGNNKIHAPNLNKLAGESVVFQKAYVTQPVCTPNRSAVMTGLWPHTSGCTENNIPLPKNISCLPELLNDSDYRTAYMGKWHLGDEIFAQHGFEEWVSMEDGYSNYYGKERDRKKRSDYHHFLIDKGYKSDRSNKFSRSFAARRPIEHCKPSFLEMKACEFLRRHRNEPFILYINFLEPHMPFFGPLDNEHNPDDVDLPANFSDPLEDNEPLCYRRKREQCIKKYGSDEKDIRSLIARYWGLVTQVDRSVGAILRTLETLGLTENTIVVYTSDHGDMMGSHHMVEKSVMYEEAVRIPWLIRIPQMKGNGRLIKNRVSQIDMVPTLLELLTAKSANSLPGQSLVPLCTGDKVDQRDVFIEWNPYSKKRLEHLYTRTVISPDGWKLCLSDVDKCQLFNLQEDPGETTNLFDSGRYGNIISRLRSKIYKWQETVGDKAKI
jgi:arylsulfatase A-like enzyme